MPGMFIDVEVDDSIRHQADIAQKLEDACPVDIFENADGVVEIVDANLDECVLCELCINAAPKGTVRVKKIYDGSVLSS
jgi:NAD-dependent dihydropyrimidine dehydrogenase PreA subunit